MAETINKRINIYINGKEVENNIKSVRSAMARLINEQAKMTIGSDEYVAHTKKIKELKSILDEHKNAIKATTEESKKAGKFIPQNIAAIANTFTGATILISKIKSATQQYIDAFAQLDDAMAAVRKTTGMTSEEVAALSEKLSNIDTRTATNELLKIAEQGGRLGLAKEDIEAFTIAVDKANVALGDSFSGGAEEIATVLGKIRNAYKETAAADVGESFNRIGSVINELGATSAASEQNIANFTQRVGAMPEVLKPTIQQTMALAASFEENSVDAEIASRSFGILMKTAAADIDKFARAMNEPTEAMRELINTNPAEFALKFAESMKGMSATQTAAYLKDLGLNADGVSKALGALGNNTDRVRELMQVANNAFSEATSLNNEFAVVNNNTAAQLEKAKNRVQNAYADLGEKISPLIVLLTNSSASFMRAVGSLSDLLIKNRRVVIAAVTAYTALLLVKNKNLIADKTHNVVLKLQTAYTASVTTATHLLALAKAKLEGNTARAAAAQRVLKGAFASTPWGAIITLITTSAVAIAHFASKTDEAAKRMADFEVEADKEKRAAKKLFEELEKLTKGSKEYNKKQQEILDLYPDLLQSQVDEKGNIIDLKSAYDELVTSIEGSIAARMKKEDVDNAYKSYIEDTKKTFSNFNAEQKLKIKELLESGNEDAAFITRILGFKTLYDNRGSVSAANNETKQYKEIQKIVFEYKELQNTLQSVNQQYDAYIDKAKKVTTTTGGNNNNGNGGNDANGGDDNKNVETWAEYYKKLEDFRKKERVNLLNDWEKTKAGIIEKYNELIEKAKTFGARGKNEAAKLEEEKGEAIINAGTAYINKYNDIVDKFYKENAESEDFDNSEKGLLLKELFGSQRVWDEKISSVVENIQTVQDVLSSLDENDPEHGQFSELLDKLLTVQQTAISLKIKESQKIVEAHAKQHADFIAKESKEITNAQLSEYDRQLLAIDERYDAEIASINATIEAKKTLIQQGANESDIQKDIEELSALIDKLEELRLKQKNNVSNEQETERTISKWEELANVLKMTPQEFSANWQDALKSVADALRETADAALDILYSINQIQDNRDKKELNDFKELQTQKLNTLENYHQQGAYSDKYYAAQKEVLQKEQEKKEKEINRRQFERNKKASIIEATIKGTLAAITSFANLGFPWGLIPMALSMATTAAQIAAISSQVNPYAKGGWINKKQIALVGEEGQEWVASNKLLTDKKTRPVIDALEKYQRGGRLEFEAPFFQEPNRRALYQSANDISRKFANNKGNVVNYINDNGEVLEELKRMNRFLSDPKNRRSYISREDQKEFEHFENELKKYSTF